MTTAYEIAWRPGSEGAWHGDWITGRSYPSIAAAMEGLCAFVCMEDGEDRGEYGIVRSYPKGDLRRSDPPIMALVVFPVLEVA